ncbi:hypothetical protein LJK88_03430 [Paenibacillus sp. P26]|nr:hypothetical protein LJK88_03430 [Paenibacillus sp. P26]
MRRYAYMILVIVATMITPPDAASAIIVFLPMIVLYEFSVFLSGIVYRKQAASGCGLGTRGNRCIVRFLRKSVESTGFFAFFRNRWSLNI